MKSHYGIFLTHTPPPFSILVREKIMLLLEIDSNLARARDWQSCQSCLLQISINWKKNHISWYGQVIYH